MIPAPVHAAIARWVLVPLHHAITPEADCLRDLHMSPVDLVSIAFDLEEQGEFLFADEPERRWRTPADIAASWREMMPEIASHDCF